MSIRKIFLGCVLILISSMAKSQLTYPAIIRKELITVSGKTTEEQLALLTFSEKLETRTYLDGLGRTIQVVNVQASPQQKDIISYGKYNNLSQQLYSYLPYVSTTATGAYRTSAATEQISFYNGSTDKVAYDSKPWSSQELEQSLLERVQKIGSVGNTFQAQTGDHFKVLKQRSNNSSAYSANDATLVQLWLPDGTSSSTYASNALTVSEITDEESNLALVYKDKYGKVILKRQYINETIEGTTETFLDTYYIYDDAGQLRFIVPPKAVVLMRQSIGYTVTHSTASKFIYEFKYDSKGRISEKKIPGQDWVYIIYDLFDRPLLTQDGNLRAANPKKWNYFKYDVKNRIISQGIYTHPGTENTLAGMLSYVPGQLSIHSYYENRQNSDPYYTNSIFPTTGIEPLLYNFFDDYDLNLDETANYSYSNQSLSGEATSSTARLRGMPTITRTKTVTVGTAIWLIKIFFYDDRGNLIQTQQDNQLSNSLSSPGDKTTMVPDFTGKPKQVKVYKSVPSGNTTTLTTYSYDHVGRRTLLQLSVNGASAVKIGEYEYNELGQVIDKKHYKINGSVLQSVDYRFNIRGQISSINNSSLAHDGGATNNESDDLFGMNFFYHTQDGSLLNTQVYNGLMSGIKWKTGPVTGDATPVEKGYSYSYDKLMRIKSANYKDKSGGTWGNAGIYDEKDIEYDHMGNINKLKRYSGTTTATDNLTYTYVGNQLTDVTDASGSSTGFSSATGNYSYDANGNLTSDPKKALALTYNVINRTQRITVTSSSNRYIDYTYMATGQVIRKEVYDNNNLLKAYDYIEGFVYENTTTNPSTAALKYFGMADGRVRIDAGPTVKYEYMITDHLGNVRISFEENSSGNATITQRTNYYAFGMVLPDAAFVAGGNKNLFNAGSEWQNDFSNMPDFYKTFYRNYDAVLGRFIGVDIRASENDNWSPYQYALNNPIRFNDPLGDKESADHSVFWDNIINILWWTSAKGGNWNNNGDGTSDLSFFEDNTAALYFGIAAKFFGASYDQISDGLIATGPGGVTFGQVIKKTYEIIKGDRIFNYIRFSGNEIKDDLNRIIESSTGAFYLAMIESFGVAVWISRSTLAYGRHGLRQTQPNFKDKSNPGVFITYNGSADKIDEVETRSYFVLAHEIGHAVDMIAFYTQNTVFGNPFDLTNKNINKIGGGTGDQVWYIYLETRALQFENWIRKEFNSPIRTQYSGVDLTPYFNFTTNQWR